MTRMDHYDLSELLTNASTGVNSAWIFLSQHYAGIAATVIATVAFLTALVLLIKHGLEVVELPGKIQQQPQQSKKILVDIEKAQQEMLSKRLEELRYDHGKLTDCVSTLATSASGLFNNLHKTFAPLIGLKPRKLKAQWNIRLTAVKDFQNQRENRPEIEQANAELKELAKLLNDPDPAIEELRSRAEELQSRTDEFLREVSKDKCFIDELEACEGKLDEELASRIKDYVDQTREAHNLLPPLAGAIKGKLPRRPAQQV